VQTVVDLPSVEGKETPNRQILPTESAGPVLLPCPARPTHPDFPMQATPPPLLIDRIVGHPIVRSGYASLLAHLVIAILLAVLASQRESPRRPPPLLLAFGNDHLRDADDDSIHMKHAVEIAPLDDAAEARADQAHVASPAPPQIAVAAPEADPPPIVAIMPPAVAATVLPTPVATARPHVRPASLPAMPAPADMPPAAQPATAHATKPPGPPTLGFAARRGETRAAAVEARGGSAASEQAVERGLAWLAEHQAVDGSWQFDLSGCRCQGACRHPGSLKSSTASTAIALLPFLGAGNTHVDGPYQQTVSRAIYYLISRMQPTPRGGDFCEGTMYGHGVTTLALAEAYGLAGDEMLVPYLRDAIRFIQTAQDQHSGGWRYLPGQSGDTTVTAWQLAALKSASIAGLETPSPTIEGVQRFLDRVQTNNGAAYGYRTPQAKPCTSAIGLLCRMYTGWSPVQEPLIRGVTVLAKPGPHPDAIYQNFYLSQALLQMNHPAWPRWNRRNRDQLVALQARIGHESGSWFCNDPDTSPGGRLAHTALAVLTLEVYYRLLPIYSEKAVRDGF
jgi:hypothetical protein